MPIIGLSEKTRLPRLGKIKLGFKDKERGLPHKSDHFICPPEVVKVYGETPTALRVLIPLEDEEQWASQYFRCYSNVRGLLCRGDGQQCYRMTDKANGSMAGKETKEIEGKELPCPGRDCDFYKAKRCKEVMFLQFLLPEVPGLGIWQIDTGSINSIRNINSCAKLIRGLYGRIAMIPLQLTLEQIEVNNPQDGKKQKVWVLNLRSDQTLIEVIQAAANLNRQLGAGFASHLALPAPDDEVPEDIVSDEEETQQPIVAATKEQVAQDTEELFGSLKSASPSPVTGGVKPPVSAQAPTAAAGPPPVARQPGQGVSGTASAPAGAVQGGGATETSQPHFAASQWPTDIKATTAKAQFASLEKKLAAKLITREMCFKALSGVFLVPVTSWLQVYQVGYMPQQAEKAIIDAAIQNEQEQAK